MRKKHFSQILYHNPKKKQQTHLRNIALSGEKVCLSKQDVPHAGKTSKARIRHPGLYTMVSKVSSEPPGMETSSPYFVNFCFWFCKKNFLFDHIYSEFIS